MKGITRGLPTGFGRLVLALLFALALLSPPATAVAQEAQTGGQQPAAGGSVEAPATGDQGTVPGTLDEAPDLDAIDEILEGEAEVLGGGGYTYDPGDRRDPFKSLVGGRDRPELRGPRPEGIPGLLIDEIDLTGIFDTQQGWVAQVQAAAKEKSYLLKEGDELYDGDVVSITTNEVVFKQIVQDPTALKPFREVTKKLNP